ncbi:MAG TPA: sigma-70 family RNA polymerase sigma factor [Gaiellales bacterium]
MPVDPAGRLAVLAAAGDGAAKAELVKQMSPLVGRLAGRMASARVPRQDLEQAGAVGVLAAVDAFDADRGTAFAPYAMRYALGEMRALARGAAAVHVSRTGRDLAAAVEAAAADLTAESGAPPTVGEIAERAGLDEEQVVTGLRARRGLAPPTGGQDELLEAHGGWEDAIEQVERRLDLGRRLEELDPRSQRIVAMRFGLELSQTEIAEHLGISQMHVSRLLRAALEQLWGDEG